MQVFDKLTKQLGDLSHQVRTMPAQLDAIAACKEAGVQIPSRGQFANLDELDMALNAAFSPDGKPLDSPTMAKRVALKNEILASGLCDHVGRPDRDAPAAQEAAARYFVNLVKKHNLPYGGKHMLTVRDLDRIMASANLEPGTRIEIKVAAEKAGVLDLENTALAKPPLAAPSPKLLRSIFAQIGHEHPAAISVVAIDRSLREHGISGTRALEIKAAINAAGLLV